MRRSRYESRTMPRGYGTAHPLFDRPAAEPSVPGVELNPSVPEHEEARLSAQHELLLARLRQGPATNVELGEICQRFGARLHELKVAGYLWTKTCEAPGVYEYRLLPRE